MQPVPLLFAALGAVILAAHWLPRFFSGREPAAAPLLLAAGAVLGLTLPGAVTGVDPVAHPALWQRVTELAVLVSLFGVGIRIDRAVGRRRLLPTARMLLVAMPVAIAATAALGLFAGGLTLAGALLLAAALAPTDPVLASDVQVGRPMEGGEHPVRLTLTAEAGLNDGLAFPFVKLALLVGALGCAPHGWGLGWVMRDLVYSLAAGVGAGWALGWLLNAIIFRWPARNPLADTDAGVVAIGGVLATYGITELVHGYGFIAVFVAGLRLKHIGDAHDFHLKLHDFVETIERSLLAVVLLALGASLPTLFTHLAWGGVALAAGLVFLIRPLAGYLALAGTHMRPRHRMVVAFYGIRGLGSLYYLGYALAGHPGDFGAPGTLWAILAFTVLLSTLVHGLTAGIAVEQVTGEPLVADREKTT